MIQIRIADPEADFPRIAELLSSYEFVPVTAEQIHEWERRLSDGRIHRRAVAVAEDGLVVGYSVVDRETWMPPGRFELWVIADASRRGQGIGAALHAGALDFARHYGASSIATNNDSRNAPMLAINRKLGYRPEPGKYMLICNNARPIDTVTL